MHIFQPMTRLALLSLFCLSYLSTPASAADLPACANRYGELMVNHWLSVSTLQQAERILYYRDELNTKVPLATRFAQQQNLVAEEERNLDKVYRNYASLFKSQ